MTEPDPDLYRLAFKTTAAPALITDEQFRVVEANDAALEFTGYDRDELVGSVPAPLFQDADDFQNLVETLAAGESHVDEVEITTSDGQIVYGRGSSTPLVKDGETRGYVGIFVDITENRRYEQSLNILNRVLRHNLRNDANVVAGTLELVADKLEDPGLRNQVEAARRRVDEMVKRANLTRHLHEVLTERDETSLRPVRLDRAIHRAVDEAGVGDAVVDVAVEDELYVVADDLLWRAIHALVENAVVHNDKPTAEVSIDVDADAEYVIVTVSDNGPGIDPEEYDYMFGLKEDDQTHHGQGMSLFFVHRLLELYDGHVEIESSETGGAVFELLFRRAEQSDGQYGE